MFSKNRKKSRSVVWGCLILGGFLLLSLLSFPPQAQARNIKVGIIDCYSGPPAVYAKDALNGFKLALKDINKKGVLGKKIVFTTRDTKFKVDIALNMAKELVMREDVDILVGTINSGASLAVSEAVAKKEKVPFIVWIAKSERITGEKGHRYVFSTGENTAMAGKAGAVALSKKPYVRYWIAGDDYEYGHAIANAAWRNLKKLKPDVEVIGKSWWKPGEPDLIPYLTSIMAAKPDAVIFCTGGRSMTNIMKAIKATNMAKKVPIWIHTATDHAVLKPLGKEAPEGVMGTMDYHFYYPDTPSNRSFVKAFKAAYGSPPGFPAFHGYITAKFIAEAFEKAGKLNKEKFIDAMEGLKIEGPTGTIEMRACDHQAVLPMFLGVTKYSPKYGVVISSNIVTLRGDQVMPSCEEIMKERRK
ncbi:MAG: amino acid ABC transporter substrate-binding protein [Deltaproteobacteria bacterium]|nr:MAG: amino acid ABC transporter substrate-binding protein [Deltaproteobacteria bacterium]